MVVGVVAVVVTVVVVVVVVVGDEECSGHSCGSGVDV
jgi:hypothetical protein